MPAISFSQDRAVEPRSGLGRIGRGLVILALWTIPPLVLTATSLASFEGDPRAPAWHQFFLNQLLIWYPWALLTPGIGWLAARFPVSGGHGGRRHLRDLSIHLLVSLFLGCAFFAWLLFQEIAAGLDLDQIDRNTLLSTLGNLVASQGLIYWLVLAVFMAIRYHQRNRERAASLTRARLQALKTQVQPHFLFNTLHAVSSLMDEDVPTARRMIVRLSELLRESLSESDQQEVLLGRELQIVKLYLEIEQVRFGDRLQVQYQIDPELHGLPVPHLLLQPLAENAIRHGVAKETRAGVIQISAEIFEEELLLKLVDDGPGLDRVPPQEGIGLGGTRTRLRELYGSDARLQIENVAPRGCQVTVALPARWI